jgi:hypothetical protein
MSDNYVHSKSNVETIYGTKPIDPVGDQERHSRRDSQGFENEEFKQIDKKVKQLIVDKAFLIFLQNAAKILFKSHNFVSLSMEEAALALQKERELLRSCLGILGINKKLVKKKHKSSSYGPDNKLDRIKTRAILNLLIGTCSLDEKAKKLKSEKDKYDRADNVPHVKSDFVAQSRSVFKKK